MGPSEREAATWLLDWSIQDKKIKNRLKKSPILTVNKQQLLLPLYSHMLLA
jgi:hypothetical protein